MAINFLDTVQISTVLNAIVAQAAGKAALATVNTKDFVAVAKVGLEAGYDKLVTAISQVLSRTIYSNRPYTRQLRLLETDTLQYGNHVRKIQFIDSDWGDNEAYKLANGYSKDPWEVKKPQAVQTNFYGKQISLAPVDSDQYWWDACMIHKNMLYVLDDFPADRVYHYGQVFTDLMIKRVQAKALASPESYDIQAYRPKNIIELDRH